MPKFDTNAIFKDISNVLPTQKENISDKDRIFRTSDYSLFESYPNESLRLELHTGEKREQLLKSIKETGINTPIKVVKKSDCLWLEPSENDSDKLIILGGHNRVDIAKELQLEIPYIIYRNMDQEKCDRLVAEEHWLNRQTAEFKPSQICDLLYAIRYDITYSESTFHEKIRESKTIEMKKTTVYRYLKLRDLIPALLVMTDSKQIALTGAYTISFLSKKEQEFVYNFIDNYHIKKITDSQAKQIHTLKDMNMSEDDLKNIFLKKEAPLKRKYDFKISVKDLKEFSMPESDIPNAKEIIKKALEQYYNTKK